MSHQVSAGHRGLDARMMKWAGFWSAIMMESERAAGLCLGRSREAGAREKRSDGARFSGKHGDKQRKRSQTMSGTRKNYRKWAEGNKWGGEGEVIRTRMLKPKECWLARSGLAQLNLNTWSWGRQQSPWAKHCSSELCSAEHQLACPWKGEADAYPNRWPGFCSPLQPCLTLSPQTMQISSVLLCHSSSFEFAVSSAWNTFSSLAPFTSQFKCHLLREVFSHHHIWAWPPNSIQFNYFTPF